MAASAQRQSRIAAAGERHLAALRRLLIGIHDLVIEARRQQHVPAGSGRTRATPRPRSRVHIEHPTAEVRQERGRYLHRDAVPGLLPRSLVGCHPSRLITQNTPGANFSSSAMSAAACAGSATLTEQRYRSAMSKVRSGAFGCGLVGALETL